MSEVKLKVNRYENRKELVHILTDVGCTVRIEEKTVYTYSQNADYYVCFTPPSPPEAQ